jgi:hypothetical protein
MRDSWHGMIWITGILAASLLIGAAGCSGSMGLGTPVPTGTRPLAPVMIRRTLIDEQSVFVGHSEAAQRVSWINADDLSEELHLSVPGDVDHFLPTPDLDGFAMVRESSLAIYASGATREFALPSRSLQTPWGVATGSAAFAFMSADGLTVKVIRYLGQATWQDETLSVPAGVAGAGNIPFFNSDGTRLIVFAKATGSYAVYQAAGTTAAMGTSAQDCTQATATSFVVTDAYFHAATGRFLVGGINGKLNSFFPLLPGCQSVAAWADASSAGKGNVIRIMAPSDTLIAVTHQGSDGAIVFSVSASTMTLAGDAGTVDGMDCPGMLDAVAMTNSNFVGYVSMCHDGAGLSANPDASGYYLSFSGDSFYAPDNPAAFNHLQAYRKLGDSLEDLGALAVDASAGNVFIQYNDARGHLVKWSSRIPGGPFTIQERDNLFLSHFFD